MAQSAEEETHEHTWTFLRQEDVPVTTWGERIEEWKVYDVFFCTKCLEYRQVHVRTEEPSNNRFGRMVTWRKL